MQKAKYNKFIEDFKLQVNQKTLTLIEHGELILLAKTKLKIPIYKLPYLFFSNYKKYKCIQEYKKEFQN